MPPAYCSLRGSKRGRSSYRVPPNIPDFYGNQEAARRLEVIEHEYFPAEVLPRAVYKPVFQQNLDNIRDLRWSDEKRRRSIERVRSTSQDVMGRHSGSSTRMHQHITIEHHSPVRAPPSPVIEHHHSPIRAPVTPERAPLSVPPSFHRDVMHVVSPLLDGIRQDFHVNKTGGVKSSAEGTGSAQEQVVGASPGKLSRLESQISELAQQNQNYREQIDTLNAKIDSNIEIQAKIDGSQASNSEMNAVITRLKKLEQSFVDLNNQNKNLLNTQQEFDQRLDNEIDQVHTDLDKKLSAVSNTTKSQISNLKSDIQVSLNDVQSKTFVHLMTIL